VTQSPVAVVVVVVLAHWVKTPAHQTLVMAALVYRPLLQEPQ
jgi:hypothetical protein